MTGTSDAIRIAPFEVDATPSIGQPTMYGTTEAVDDPLSCRGIVLFADDAPIVLATIDWLGNYNGGHDAWRFALADAAGTSPERVAIHSVHQHEAPAFDADAETLLLAHGTEAGTIDSVFARETIRRTATAVREAIADPVEATHLGVGSAEIEKVASNRQVLGEDGTCCYVRFTSGGDDFEFAQSAPEGIVDPRVRVLSFWNGDEPLAVLSYYATHPQSYYRNGRVTCDFPGIARNRREEETGVFQVHFNGASGNVTAGKYNDGSEELRPVLADRVAEGMAEAWADTERTPVSASDVGWTVEPVALPVADDLDRESLVEELAADPEDGTARDLAWLHRREVGQEIDLTCLRLNDTRVLHMPGELFVEYQLAAARMRPDLNVVMAAYGDGGPGYIGTRAAYPKGGYEVRVSNVSPDVEDVLTPAMRDLLDAESVDVEPSDITAEKPRTSRSAEQGD